MEGARESDVLGVWSCPVMVRVFPVLVLLAIALASPATGATLVSGPAPVAAPAIGTSPEAFAALLEAWSEGHGGVSAPAPPARAEMILHSVLLIALSTVLARALPRRRRSQHGLRAQAARAAEDMSRMR